MPRNSGVRCSGQFARRQAGHASGRLDRIFSDDEKIEAPTPDCHQVRPSEPGPAVAPAEQVLKHAVSGKRQGTNASDHCRVILNASEENLGLPGCGRWTRS